MDLLQSLTKSREICIPAAIDRAMCMNMIVVQRFMYESKCLMICVTVNYVSHVLIMPKISKGYECDLEYVCLFPAKDTPGAYGQTLNGGKDSYS